MGYPKVLVAAPVFDQKDYCLEKYLKHIEDIDYPNYDHIMVDNSEDDWFFKKLQFLEVESYKVNRGANSREAICNSMNFIRDYFLERDYDYLLIVESDLFVDKDVINRLLNHNKSIVGSFYLLGNKEADEPYDKALKLLQAGFITRLEFNTQVKGLQPRRACLFILDRKPTGALGTRNLAPSEGIKWFSTGLRQIHGCGLGCTLIRRDIIHRFPYWTDSRFGNKHHDVYFYMDLHQAGIKVYVDTNVLITHQPSMWDDVKDM